MEKVLLRMEVMETSWDKKMDLYIKEQEANSKMKEELNDPGGSWWPPAKPTWTPIIVLLSIFSFLNCSATYYF